MNSSFPGATALQIRLRPLVPHEPIISLAYPGNERRVATGRFMRYGADDDRFAGMALLEIGELRPLSAEHQDTAQGARGRLVLVCTELLSLLSSGRPPRAADRPTPRPATSGFAALSGSRTGLEAASRPIGHPAWRATAHASRSCVRVQTAATCGAVTGSLRGPAKMPADSSRLLGSAVVTCPA